MQTFPLVLWVWVSRSVLSGGGGGGAVPGASARPGSRPSLCSLWRGHLCPPCDKRRTGHSKLFPKSSLWAVQTEPMGKGRGPEPGEINHVLPRVLPWLRAWLPVCDGSPHLLTWRSHRHSLTLRHGHLPQTRIHAPVQRSSGALCPSSWCQSVLMPCTRLPWAHFCAASGAASRCVGGVEPEADLGAVTVTHGPRPPPQRLTRSAGSPTPRPPATADTGAPGVGGRGLLLAQRS